MRGRASCLLLGLLFLTGAAGGLLVVEGRVGRGGRAEPFQRLVGGVGTGPVLDLSGCPFRFDPRLDDSCVEEGGPIPGGLCYCPRGAGASPSSPPPRHRETGHAPLP